ncbi:hypothetical protein NIES2135_27420 [Leptolyngbya boryana NIES-2135]|jgi:uncharacterized protein GlcG (DUF336 family)|uniref:Heme-binding protein n=1 Tax=Leptolyngbya boryana NIES-2135 TaxID=1973484 RepID=A0A1Z4JGN2_LEPBY|nr:MULTISPECIES: heme-binding protein [Leptolyngbya]BAY55916.1 hypothetical protein NIES2135_27420 [Leptolyngbya boryana NIES-2135]MBD2368783.1 heme-binding protein [Leptolyngbya sp. FACHB-161]MBD2375349.1 heme-binding protein [Leptolyngbya sp. FACHB-238]MBD2399767.1 heme-binding protein [Leptolyngbya sp. FACHB-239]MBD2405973.1 heme-binding protein [Leptolyngbya sp. FACHB-402]
MQKRTRAVVSTVVFSLLAVNGTHAFGQSVRNEKQISLELASEAAMSAIAQCREQGFRVSAVVLDRGGNTKIAMTDDSAGLHTLDSARRKAYTALTFRVPSAEFAKRVATTPALASFEGVIALAGGLPIRSGNEVIGSIGIGGAPAGERDEGCAQTGIRKIQSRL